MFILYKVEYTDYNTDRVLTAKGISEGKDIGEAIQKVHNDISAIGVIDKVTYLNYWEGPQETFMITEDALDELDNWIKE